MKKTLNLLPIIVITGISALTACSSNYTYIKNINSDTEMIGLPFLYYKTKENVKKDEKILLETSIIGNYKKDHEQSQIYPVDFTELTEDDLDFHLKVNTENKDYSYKLNDEEKTGVLYGSEEDTRTLYELDHNFEIDADYFSNEEKTTNWVLLTVVINSTNEEVTLLLDVFYSQLKGKTIFFSLR